MAPTLLGTLATLASIALNGEAFRPAVVIRSRGGLELKSTPATGQQQAITFVVKELPESDQLYTVSLLSDALMELGATSVG